MNEHLLDIKKLSVGFNTDEGYFKAVEDVSFYIDKGEVVGLVGESGCGKSVTSLSILRLNPIPISHIESGEILFKGKDLLNVDAEALKNIRGRDISMIFQEPLAALSPLQRIGSQMAETLLIHEKDTSFSGHPVPDGSHGWIERIKQKITGKETLSRKQAWAMAKEWLEKVKISDAEERLYAYPFHLSGGMQQRIMIAMALMLNPDLIIADEPTTALDVTIQAQVFKLIREMKQEKTSILLITHDMGVVWEMCDRVMVMYASNIVEQGTVQDIFTCPAHPYTQGLLASMPILTEGSQHLNAIPGNVPSPMNYPAGCRFHNRCPHAFERCREEKPVLRDVGSLHRAACFLADKLVLGKN